MTAREKLWDVALEQHGFVTSSDARDLGLTRGELPQLAYRGKIARVAQGVYRFTEFPTSPDDEYALALLWTGNKQAVLSHDTALDVYNLCDINPNSIHITVPKSVRIQRAGGTGYILHRENLTPDRVGWWNGLPTVTERTALEQGVESGVPTYLLSQAIATARARGRISADDERHIRQTMEDAYVR